MCDELKRQITSEQNGINNDSNFLFGYQKTEKDRNHSELLEAIEQRKTIKDEYEKKYRKLISRTVPLYDSNSDNEDRGLLIIEPSYIGINSPPKITIDCLIALVTISILIITPIEIGFIHAIAERFFS